MSQTILLVEDEEDDVFFMQLAMQKAGVMNAIQVASDGREAIDYFKGTGKFADRVAYPLPSLVLLDLKLPHVMGLDVLKWIRQQPELTPTVIIFSSSREDADVAAAEHLGANEFLVKPADVSKLVDMARSIKNCWLAKDPALPVSGIVS